MKHFRAISYFCCHLQREIVASYSHKNNNSSISATCIVQDWCTHTVHVAAYDLGNQTCNAGENQGIHCHAYTCTYDTNVVWRGTFLASHVCENSVHSWTRTLHGTWEIHTNHDKATLLLRGVIALCLPMCSELLSKVMWEAWMLLGFRIPFRLTNFAAPDVIHTVKEYCASGCIYIHVHVG